MQIRPYVAADWPRLCAIYDAARWDELRLSAGTAAFLPLLDAADNEGLFAGELWVAELDGMIEGFIACSAEEISWLYVSPHAYRRGIGRALLRHAIAAGNAVLKTEMLEGNEPALQLYRSEGFVVTERRAGRLQGNESFAATGYILERRR